MTKRGRAPLPPRIITTEPGVEWMVHPDTVALFSVGTFRPLSRAEVEKYRAWADSQPDGTYVEPVWHPVVQDRLLRTGRGTINR